MENIENDLSSKLKTFFKERLNHLEEKALKHLKDLEILKYQSHILLKEGNIYKIKFNYEFR